MMGQQTERRVVITGLGVVAPNGIGKQAFWHATSNGISGIKPIQCFPTADLPIRVGGEVSDFVVEQYIERKLAKRTDRMTHLALAAVQNALEDARIDITQENPQRVGIVIANTIGGAGYAYDQIELLYTRGPRAMSPFTSISWLQVANVGQTSLRYGIQGYCKTPVNDTAGGLDALGLASSAIRRGAADVIITGGCEALLQPYILLVMTQGAVCLPGDDPNAYRPFDCRAAGLLLAEGAGICILEDYEHALKRGVPLYGEIVGFGQTNDAQSLRNAPASGDHYARAMGLAMREGDLSSRDLGYVSLDGRALPAFDQIEAEALYQVFGADAVQLPVSVPRTMLGHSFAAAGVLDTITALLSLEHRLIPPTINCEEMDPRYKLNLVRGEAHRLTKDAVLICGRGLTGANVALAVRKI
ncbi:MAG: beta-ketoacyl-[acyl-carrier-protein] synthase family protein [Chloroflexota bacterium]|nr:beta-ketoacyl-[acyl-carrier-protein] synthase family protein [Chloroflexota bacterium]